MPELIFDAEFLKKLEYLYIVSKRIFGGQSRAERRARKHGSGLEFADHRGYSPGDDFRHVDWNAYQRLEKLLLRLFEEEQDLPIYIFLDTSRSMGVGPVSKLRYGQQVAAALTYIGLAQLDRVTLFGFNDSLRQELPALRGKGQIFTAFGFLAALAPEGDTRPAEVLAEFCATRRQRGMAVVISDFLFLHGFERGLDLLRFHQHEVFVLHLTSQADRDAPLRGEVCLVDAETGLVQDLDVTPAMAHAYRRAYDRYTESLASYCWKYGVGYVATPTELPFEDAILTVFRRGGFLA